MSPVESEEQELTRKERREQARAQRRELEQAEAARAARRKRLGQLGIVVAGVLVAIVVILVATGGGGKSGPAKSGSPKATETTSTVNALIGGIPQNGTVLGDPKAPVTLQYFADLECPVCRDFTVGALESIVPRWVRTGKVKIEYRNLQTATREPEVFRSQQVAALAAGKQNKLWNFAETFYREQGEEGSGYVTDQFLQKVAEQIPGLNLPAWTAARNEAGLASQLATDSQLAAAQGFTGTPSFLIGKTGGAAQKLEYSSLSDPGSFNTAIEKLLKA
jgi:protein-disulfide isomerase